MVYLELAITCIDQEYPFGTLVSSNLDNSETLQGISLALTGSGLRLG